MGTASSQVNRIVPAEIATVSSSRSPTIWLTGWPVDIDRPKSPCSSPVSDASQVMNHCNPTQRRYCRHAGSSKRNCWRRSSICRCALGSPCSCSSVIRACK